MNIEQERLLLERIHHDRQQFGILFDEYYSSIFGYAFRRTAEYDASRDIATETFLKAFLNIENFRWKGIPLSAWLYRIAANEINQYFRKKKYQPEVFSRLRHEEQLRLEEDESEEDTREKMEKELTMHTDFLRIQKQLLGLPLSYQEVMALRYFEEKSISEISLITGKKEGTVKSLLSRGIEKLRSMNR